MFTRTENNPATNLSVFSAHRNPRRNQAALLVILACLLAPPPAYGYIDPNMHGLLAQTLTPLLVIGATVGVFFREKATAAIHWVGRRLNRFTHGHAE
jgi:hypothetical protein